MWIIPKIVNPLENKKKELNMNNSNEIKDEGYLLSTSNFRDIILSEFKSQHTNLKTMQEKILENLNPEERTKYEKEQISLANIELEKLSAEEKEVFAISQELGKIESIIETQRAIRLKEKKMQYKLNKDTVLDIKETMVPYLELFEDSLFDEAFILLEQNVEKLDGIIEKNKHIRDFFSLIADKTYFSYLLDNNKLLPISSSFVENLMEKEFLKVMGSKLSNFIDSDMTSVMFSLLLVNNEFDKAKFLLSFSQDDISQYKRTLKTILEKQNGEAIRFICENMKNIHYNEDSLLRVCIDMPTSTIKMLIENFNFDLNMQSQETGNNFVMALANDSNLKNFKFIVENYSNKINWGALKYERKKNISFFDMVDDSGKAIEFYSILLNDLTLKSNYVERIAKSLLESMSNLEKAIQTDVLEKLFSHPNFDQQVVNLGQHYFLYGLLSKLGTASLAKGAKDSAEKQNEALVYLKVLEAYLDNHTDDSVPDSTDYHIVGAAVWIASESDTKITNDAASLIMRRYPQYINKPNPDSKLPIMQVAEGSTIYRTLVNNGAIPAEMPSGWWDSVISSFTGNKKAKQLQAKLEAAQQKVEEKAKEEDRTPLAQVRAEMRANFIDMKGLISDPACDSIIKFKCENMFLNAEILLKLMEQHKVIDAFEEINFLHKNFSDYLKNSLNAYISLCHTTMDFAPEDTVMAKLEAAKKVCMEQVDLLSHQVDQMKTLMFADVEREALSRQRVQSRFLAARLEGTTKNYDVDLKTTHENNNTPKPVTLGVDNTNQRLVPNKEVELVDLGGGNLASKQDDLNSTVEKREAVSILNSAEDNVEVEREMEIGATLDSSVVPIRRNKM